MQLLLSGGSTQGLGLRVCGGDKGTKAETHKEKSVERVAWDQTRVEVKGFRA